MGFKPGSGTPEPMRAQIELDMRLFRTVIRERNLKFDTCLMSFGRSGAKARSGFRASGRSATAGAYAPVPGALPARNRAPKFQRGGSAAARQRHPAAGPKAVALQRRVGVVRASRKMSAMEPDQRRECVAVKLDESAAATPRDELHGAALLGIRLISHHGTFALTRIRPSQSIIASSLQDITAVHENLRCVAKLH